MIASFRPLWRVIHSVVLSRSAVYTATAPYRTFVRHELRAPAEGAPGRFTMRTIWRLHSGELFGEIGRFAVDTLALALLVLCVTGLILTFFPRITHRLQVKRRRAANRFTLQSLRWHNRIGVSTWVFVFVLTLTGMFLRPPLLILIAGGKHTPVPHTVEDSPNAWWDELRMVRRDTAHGEWLFYTAHGFYTVRSLADAPQRVRREPPTGFMGPNVLRQVGRDEWIVGSFAGLYRWNRATGESYDLIRRCRYMPPTHAGMSRFHLLGSPVTAMISPAVRWFSTTIAAPNTPNRSKRMGCMTRAHCCHETGADAVTIGRGRSRRRADVTLAFGAGRYIPDAFTPFSPTYLGATFHLPFRIVPAQCGDFGLCGLSSCVQTT